MTSFWQDVRYSLRVIAKAPGFAAIVILTLALGIGANTTIFSWINATLLNPIPGLASPNEVVALSLGRPGDNPFPFTYPDFEMMRAGQHSFAGLTGCNPTPMSLTGNGKPERVWGTVASANYFDVLGVRPILGRGFLPVEDGKPGGAPVAVISYRLWQTHFGANPGVVGQTIEINQHPYTIVGVAPAVFQGSQTCAGLFIRSFMRAQQINPGFNSHNVLIASYDLFTSGYSDASGAAFDRQLVAKLEALPGIRSVALSNRVPLGFGGGSTAVKPEGYVPQANESMETQVSIVTPNYFQTMQIPIVKGRDFTLQDTMKSQRAVIVSETFVNRYWTNREAMGKQLNSDLTHEWFTVVGVARDSKVNGLNEKPTPFLYLPEYQVYRTDHPGGSTMIIIARTTGDPLALGKTVESAIHDLNADLVVFDVTTLELRQQLASIGQRVAGTFVGAFGLLALVLAAVGIYGVTAYTTRQRTHEIGIRMALGASKNNILRLVIGHGHRLTLVGVALGLAASFGLTRYLSSMLLGVTSTDALTVSSVAILLCVVALFACFIPARRAMRVDPNVALRYE
jgi:ABC-type antimicrobial peptide transport system permease subunit